MASHCTLFHLSGLQQGSLTFPSLTDVKQRKTLRTLVSMASDVLSERKESDPIFDFHFEVWDA